MPRKDRNYFRGGGAAARARLWRAALCLLLVLCGGSAALAQPSLVSLNAGGNNSGNGHSDATEQGVSDDGRFVIFTSDAPDLVANDTNGMYDVFLRDLATGTTTLVSVNAAGTASGNSHSGVFGQFQNQFVQRSLALSGNGRFVAFSSAATDLTADPVPGGAVLNLFVRDMALGTTKLVSVNPTGTGGGTGNSIFPFITTDGSSVGFRSNAPNLVANDTNGAALDVFVRRLTTNTTLLVSVNAAGTGSGDRGSQGATISDDGRYVAFWGAAGNLVANDTNGTARGDVFVRDLVAGTTRLVSATPDNAASGNGDSFSALISRDGSRVVFVSTATDLVALPDNNNTMDVFVRDLRTNTTALASVNSQGTAAGGGLSTVLSHPAISDDGSRVAFFSNAPDLVALPDNNGDNDIFVRNVDAGTTTLVTVNAAGTASGNGPAGENSIGLSGDGRFVSFESTADDLVAGPASNFLDVFVHDLLAGTTAKLSKNAAGTNANDHSFRPVLSRNGAVVVFSSEAGNLDPRDTDTQSDVFSVSFAGPVQFSAVTFAADEGAGTVNVTVTRTGDTSAAASVDYATTNGAATDRKDYTAALGRLRFAAGETSKTFQIVITDDRFDDDGESFTVTLGNPVGATLGAPASATVNINDNDAASGVSPVRDAAFNKEFFVRQHYADFLGRVPDAGGLQFWMNNIDSCVTDQCREVRKIDTSAAFFLSIEFQETGFLAVRAHKAAFGNLANKPVPITLRDFLFDSRLIGEGVVVGTPGWPEQLEANKVAYFNEFVARTAFTSLYPQAMTAAEFVDALFAKAEILPTQDERNAAINAFGAGGTAGRAAALRSVAESQTLKAAETNKAFVLMQYFGYLRRNPDDPDFQNNPDPQFLGYQFWLGKLNQFDGSYVDAEMVKAFIQSIEYGDRFGQ